MSVIYFFASQFHQTTFFFIAITFSLKNAHPNKDKEHFWFKCLRTDGFPDITVLFTWVLGRQNFISIL